MIVLMSVPNEEGIPVNPNLTNKETKEANTDEAIANIIHFLPSLFSSSFLSIISNVPINIKAIDKNTMQIIIGFPPLVVSSKKNIKNKIDVNINDDLSIGATLFTLPSFIALK